MRFYRMAQKPKGDKNLKNPKTKLSRTVAVRMSDAEYAKLAEMADDAALSLGAFIRFTLFGMGKINTEGIFDVH